MLALVSLYSIPKEELSLLNILVKPTQKAVLHWRLSKNNLSETRVNDNLHLIFDE